MDYCAKFRYFAVVSAAILVIGLIVGIVAGPNYGIDFSGGSIFTIEMAQDFKTEDVQKVLSAMGITDASVVSSGATTDSKTQAIIRLKPFGSDDEENQTRQDILAELQKTYPNASVAGVDRVGAVASRDLVRNAIISVILASVLILVYVWIRFELLQGVAAVAALLHDVLIMFAVTTILQIPINSSFIAAMLTIVGYSINNTIVIFDRVRENTHLSSRRGLSRSDTVNASITQSMTRTINTTVTTLLTIVCVYLLGVDSIKEFSMPIIIGIVAGTYSSVFLVAPFWELLVSLEKKKA